MGRVGPGDLPALSGAGRHLVVQMVSGVQGNSPSGRW